MEESYTINVLLMENEKSGKRLVGLLEDFSTKNQTELLVFDDENKALNFLKDNKPPSGEFTHYIVLFNLNPPLTNAMDVISEIKEDPDLKSTPVFIITSSIEDKDVMKAYNCHVNCFITKPEDMEGLVHVLDSFKEFWFKLAKLP